MVLLLACSSLAEPPEIIYEITHPDYEQFISTAKKNNINLDFVKLKKNVMLDIEEIQKSVVYPDYAKDNNIQGRVIIKVLIDNQDRVLSVNILKSDNDYLNGSALKAIYNAEYYSAIGMDGEKVATYISVPLSFKLRDKQK